MTHHPHELYAEFPNDHDRIQHLKQNDARFRHLAEHYEEVNHEIGRIESGLQAADDTRLEALKKIRLTVIDELYEKISLAKVA